MSFGITEQGFVAKRLEDIKNEIEDKLKSTLGNDINLLPESNLGNIVGIFSERESLLWELLEAIYNSQFPSTASGSNLDQVVSITGIERLGAVKSLVDLKVFGDIGTLVTIGSQISRSGSNGNVIFQTKETVQILNGVDEQQRISFNNTPDGGVFRLSFNGEETPDISFNDTSAVIQSALNALPDLSSVLVTGDFSGGFNVNFGNTDGEKPQDQIQISSNSLNLNATQTTILVTTVTEGELPNATVQAESTIDGVVFANSGTLSVIETPITGWDSVTNPNDATPGRLEETDAELKIRREDALQIAGTSTVDAIFSQVTNISGVNTVKIFENFTEIPDLEGRPAKSYEVVVRGGDESEIAQTVWDTKPAGIRTVGLITANAQDTEGFTQSVSFSRPVEVPIFITMNITKDLDFPTDGASQILANILTYGNTFDVGQDVITIPRLLCVLNEIVGILDVDVFVGTSSNPTSSDNIIIADNQVAGFDSSRIVIN